MSRHDRLSPIASCLLMIALLPIIHHSSLITVVAQSATATLSGRVVDQNGAVIPAAEIVVTSNATALERTTTTNESGYFSVPLLPPGSYFITTRREGFLVVRVPEVMLNVGDQRALQIQLKAGDVNATVTVDSNADTIRTDAGVATVVDRQFVENIPLNGRSFQSLITLTPGVVIAPGGRNDIGQFSVNGQRTSANSFMVDGVSANFGAGPGAFGFASSSGNTPGLTTFGSTQSLVSVDAMQEFKVQTSTYSAEYGRQPGGQISIVTRSGTNQFHGSAFEYLRNDVFDANDWFANRAGQPRPPQRQNDFGGTFGGPVLLPRFGEGGSQPGYNGRNRTFFFFSYEGLRLLQPQFVLTNVPTLALRQQAQVGIRPILNGFPLPNGRDLGNGMAELTAGYSDRSTLNATSIRIDHTVNSKLTLFARYNKAPSESDTRRLVALSSRSVGRLDAETITVSAISSLTPSTSNDFRVNYSVNGANSITVMDNFGGATAPPRSALIPTQFDSGATQGGVVFQVAGLTAASAPQLAVTGPAGQISTQRQINIVDNISFAHGAHQLKFGVDYRRLSPIVSFNNYAAFHTFTTQQQILNATAGTGSISASAPRKPILINFSAYAQDSWKLSRRLTLDLGLRWDVNPASSEADGKNPVPADQINNLATMQLVPGKKEWKTTYNNFAPRLGLAYLVSQASGRETVVRGGFGVFYDTGSDLAAVSYNQRFPYSSNRGISNVTFPLSPIQIAPAPLPIDTGLAPPFGTLNIFDPFLRLPYTFQWNMAVERSLGRSQVVTVSYVGAAGRRLLQSTQLNLASINPKFSTVRLTKNNATSDYNALQAQFQRRLSRGLQVLMSYTWSHALDDDSSSVTNRVALRGNAAFDIRHNFTGAATYDLPFQSSNPIARGLLGSWSLDASVRAQSALPVDLVATTFINPADGSTVSVRPNVILEVPLYVQDSTVPGGRRINSAAFSAAPAGQSGNFGRNQVRGLGAWQIDAALRRQINLTENVRLQIRAEGFNVFNHPNFGAVQTSLTASNFGQATNMLGRQLGGLNALYQMGGPRSFQFALKIIF